MSTMKVAISLEENLLKQVDRLVQEHFFQNRSKAIQEAVEEKLSRIDKYRLAKECAKLDPHEEKALAEEGFASEINQWPEY